MTNRHQLTSAEDALQYIGGGKGSFTFLSKPTGQRFTYKLATPRDVHPTRRTPIFVKLLTGADNETSYQYIGCLWDLKYAHGRRSRITSDATGVKAFSWVIGHLNTGSLPDEVEIWHEGRCGRCGRKLTVPASITRGIGPTCAGRVA